MTAAAPGADLLLKRLLRQPLIAQGARALQGCCCPEMGPGTSVGHACMRLRKGLVTMARTRRLVCHDSEGPDAAGPMVGILLCHMETFSICLMRPIILYQ